MAVSHSLKERIGGAVVAEKNQHFGCSAERVRTEMRKEMRSCSELVLTAVWGDPITSGQH